MFSCSGDGSYNDVQKTKIQLGKDEK